jgi:hypothetical protein
MCFVGGGTLAMVLVQGNHALQTHEKWFGNGAGAST